MSGRSSLQKLVYELQHPQPPKSHRQQLPILDVQQISKKMKKQWRDPGHCNLQFNPVISLKGKMLNDWQMSRICMATRSYHIPKGIWLNDTDVKGYRYDASSRVFPVISQQCYPVQFRERLKKIEVDNQNLKFNKKMEIKMNKRTVTEFSLRSERTKQSLNALKLENEFKPIKTFNPYSTKSRLFGFDKLTYFRGNHSVAGKQCTVAL